MKKSNIIVILLGLGVLIFLFWLLFLRDDPQADKPQQNQKNTTTPNTTNNQSPPVDASSSRLTAAENKEIQTFLRDFTQKYVSYDESKPSAGVESVKNMMTPEVYQEQLKNYQKFGINNIKVRKINIDSIKAEERYITSMVSIDVTIKYPNNQQRDTIFHYTFYLYNEQSGWRVGSISDDTTEENQ
jgi:hypothetical protein